MTTEGGGGMITPRVIRHCKAPAYLGMCKEVFERDVRPFVPEVPVGNKGVGFDRLDLDAWFEQHKRRNGRPAKKEQSLWDEQERGVSPSKVTAQEPSTRRGDGKESSPGLDRYRRKTPKTGLPVKSSGAKPSSYGEEIIDRCLGNARGGT